MIGSHVSKFDTEAIKLVAALPQGLRPVFELMSYVGHPIATCFVGFVVAAYGLFKHNPLLALSGASVWLTMLVSTLLKNLTERARPVTEYVAGMHVQSFSFPSGHTTGSTIAFGLLAYIGYHLLPTPFKLASVIVMALLILMVGVSRIYLGAHFPTDVIGGWMLGGIVLCIVIFVIKPL